MILNKRNRSENYEFNSDNSKNYELKSDTLDQLYKEQLTELRDLILKNAESNDMEICRKWVKVFNGISEDEKMARNCLCTLMLEQVKESGCLQEPFINLQNCNRNLECILQELDQVSADLSNQSFPPKSDDTFKSHVFITFEQNQESNELLQKNLNIKMKAEITDLAKELQILRLQLTEKEIENIKIQEIAEKYRVEKETFEGMLDDMKRSVLESIRKILLDIEQYGIINTFQFFQYIFAQFANDKEFMGILSKYDTDLQHIFNKQFKCKFDKQKHIIARHICRKFFISKTKLLEKFKHRLAMQNDSHKLQLKLAKVNSFLILRQIFINHYSESGKFEGWNILKAFEDKYQSILDADPK